MSHGSLIRMTGSDLRFGFILHNFMLTFRQYLLESETHPHLVSVTSDKETPHISTHFYRDSDTGVHTRIHTDAKRGIAYWGFQVPNAKGELTDVAPPDVPKEVRSARLRTAMDHVTDFARSNPKIAQVQYQTNAGERGEKNHAIFQSKWGEAQKQHGIETPLVRVEKHPFR